jgi:hypothetical protein
MSSLTEEGVDPSSNYNGLELSLLYSGTGEDFITRVLGNRQGLTSECGLINLKRISLQKTSISWDNVS